MVKQTSKAQIRQSGAANSDDYEHGLKILARIIARRHMQRVKTTSENKGEKNSSIEVPFR